ncbi:MAG: DNA recombination protein RmuC [Candidatus Methylomirabilales bacterium]
MEQGLFVLAAAIVAAALILARRRRANLIDPEEIAARLGAGAEATRSLQARLDQTAASLASLAGAFEERRRLEEQTTEAVGRVERLVAGSYSKGRVGENLLAAALAEFPPEMVVFDFRVGGRVCEFALRLPDGKLLPVDSKWSSADLVAELEASTDPARRDELRRRVEKAVCGRVREVASYIDPSLTAPVAVAAVPDAVYAWCRRSHAVANDVGVLIVSYGLAVPLLLGMWCLYRTYARNVETDELLARIHEVSRCLGELRDRVEGKLSRAITTAGNAAFEMRALLAAAQASLAALERTQTALEKAQSRAEEESPSAAAV